MRLTCAVLSVLWLGATLVVTAQPATDRVVEGALEVEIAEDFIAAPVVTTYLRTDRGRVRVRGLDPSHREAWAGARLRVRLRGDTAQTVDVLTAAASLRPMETKTVGLMLATFADRRDRPWTTAQITTHMAQVRDFYLVQSYGTLDLHMTVYDWVDTEIVAGTGCPYTQVSTTLQSHHGLPVHNSTGFLFPSIHCPWAGLGIIGGMDSQTQFWLNGNLGAAAHEIGHNYGFTHSRAESRRMNGTVMHEYTPAFDYMGSGAGHANAQHKDRADWLMSPHLTTVVSSGQYWIAPLEVATVTDEPRALYLRSTVKNPSGNPYIYHVELRPAGQIAVWRGELLNSQFTPVPWAPVLMDHDPGDADDWALSIAQSFTAHGITVTPLAVDQTGALIDVSVPAGPAPASNLRAM